DARDGAQHALGVLGCRRGLDSFGMARNHAQEISSPAFDSRGVKPDIGEFSQDRCSRLKPESHRSRCGLAMAVYQRTERLARIDPGLLLLEDRRRQGVDEATGSRQSQAGMTADRLAQDTMLRRERPGIV